MLNNPSLLSIFYILGAAHGVFLVVALFTSKAGSHKANVYLGLYTLVFAIALFGYFTEVTGLREEYIYLRTLLWPKEFLYGALIYFYTRELIHPGQYPLRGSQWLHFVPFALHVALTWPLLLLSDAAQTRVLDGADVFDNTLERVWAIVLGDIEVTMTLFHIAIYLVLAIRLVLQHQQRALKHLSFTEQVSLSWLRNLLLGTLIVYVTWVAREFLSISDDSRALLDTTLGLSIVVLIYAMGYLGLRQPVIFSASFPSSTTESIAAPEAAVDPTSDDNKYKRSSLSSELCEVLMTELDTYMQSDRAYLDNQLSLPQLAERLGVSVNYLSQTINQQTDKNFFDYINSYRVEEAKHLFKAGGESPKNILDIAMSAGFNSKSAFYTAFKKHTGMTPGAYRKTLK